MEFRESGYLYDIEGTPPLRERPASESLFDYGQNSRAIRWLLLYDTEYNLFQTLLSDDSPAVQSRSPIGGRRNIALVFQKSEVRYDTAGIPSFCVFRGGQTTLRHDQTSSAMPMRAMMPFHGNRYMAARLTHAEIPDRVPGRQGTTGRGRERRSD